MDKAAPKAARKCFENAAILGKTCLGRSHYSGSTGPVHAARGALSRARISIRDECCAAAYFTTLTSNTASQKLELPGPLAVSFHRAAETQPHHIRSFRERFE